eukprot:7058463-Karenia_brevis.AAC.1
MTWVVSQDKFMEILNGLVDSGPGPDGIRYSAWANAPFRIKQILYIAYRLWIAGHPLPAGFNFAFLCLLPKGCEPGDADLLVRSPTNTRPLSLSN